MTQRFVRCKRGTMMAGLFILGGLVVCAPRAWADDAKAGKSAAPASASAVPSTAPSTAPANQTPATPGSTRIVPHSEVAERWLARRYGVDHLHVRYTASGSSLEFRYRVLDPQKAQILNDKRANPILVDLKSGRKLTVPTMEKIGALRQTATVEQGREYWMVFSNPGKFVKPGERVDVVVGSFRASGLIVE